MSLPNLHVPEEGAIIQRAMATSSTPSRHSSTATASDESGPFLRVPREVRDQIYRYLLSTKHTKHNCREPEMDTLRCVYTYQFHTSILFTNRQVYNEASNIFYMENLFIRVNSVERGPYWQPGPNGVCNGLPILSKGPKAQACTRHVMEIDLIPRLREYDHHRNHHFIFACHDLSMFCRALRVMDGCYHLETKGLLGMELWIIIGDEVGIAGENFVDSNTSTDGRKAEILTAATKNAVASRENPIKHPRSAIERNATVCEDTNGSGSASVNGIKEAKTRLSEPPIPIENPRVRRLLEPFRTVYNVGYSYIDAPISERYWQEIQTSLSRARPSVNDLFSVAYSAFEEGSTTSCVNESALAIHKMRGTLDTLYDFRKYIRDGVHESRKVTTGPYTGFECRKAVEELEYITYNNLARAHLRLHTDLQHVRTAQAWARYIVHYVRDCMLYAALPRDSHELAMAHYQEAEVWEALDQLGEHTGRLHSEALDDVITMLAEALKNEPGNTMLEQELERRREEKKTAETDEKLKRRQEEKKSAGSMGEPKRRQKGRKSQERWKK